MDRGGDLPQQWEEGDEEEKLEFEKAEEQKEQGKVTEAAAGRQAREAGMAAGLATPVEDSAEKRKATEEPHEDLDPTATSSSTLPATAEATATAVQARLLRQMPPPLTEEGRRRNIWDKSNKGSWSPRMTPGTSFNLASPRRW